MSESLRRVPAAGGITSPLTSQAHPQHAGVTTNIIEKSLMRPTTPAPDSPRPSDSPLPDHQRQATTAVDPRAHPLQKAFPCSFAGCRKSFTTATGRKMHLVAHTQECTVCCLYPDCGEKFTVSATLKAHLLRHTEEEPKACPVEGCDKRFTSAKIRNAHLLNHVKKKLFTCPCRACGRRFSRYRYLQLHVRIHSCTKSLPCSVQGRDSWLIPDSTPPACSLAHAGPCATHREKQPPSPDGACSLEGGKKVDKDEARPQHHLKSHRGKQLDYFLDTDRCGSMAPQSHSPLTSTSATQSRPAVTQPPLPPVFGTAPSGHQAPLSASAQPPRQWPAPAITLGVREETEPTEEEKFWRWLMHPNPRRPGSRL
ncbi:MAG: hypothetical protein OXC07_02885 [Kistimonas sp.]|nr:hypothetical protein [Kistimonas sp.]